MIDVNRLCAYFFVSHNEDPSPLFVYITASEKIIILKLIWTGINNFLLHTKPGYGILGLFDNRYWQDNSIDM